MLGSRVRLLGHRSGDVGRERRLVHIQPVRELLQFEAGRKERAEVEPPAVESSGW